MVKILEMTKSALESAQLAIELAIEAEKRGPGNGAQEAPLEPIPCKHPDRKTVATMTNPKAWYCPDCLGSGDGNTPANNSTVEQPKEKEG